MVTVGKWEGQKRIGQGSTGCLLHQAGYWKGTNHSKTALLQHSQGWETLLGACNSTTAE